MSEDHDPTTDTPMDRMESVEELASGTAVETVAAGDVGRVLLPVVGGSAVLLSALRSLGRGQLRAVPKAAVGAALFGYGLRNRRSSGPETFAPSTDGVESPTTETDAPDSARDETSGSRIEFTDDGDDSEPRTKPDDVAESADPRRNTGDGVEIDVSDSAMADEASEATGPDPEQAQPTRTDAIEPEDLPDEDGSDVNAEPDDGEDGTADEAGSGDDDASENGDDRMAED